jgi:hypothetical protein
MALFITYDEEGGFFDHLVPPTPDPGRSTVPITNEIFPGSANHPAGPYGFGVRVPTIVVSPWTRGGWVNSELFDHTSLIRFLERRFAGLTVEFHNTGRAAAVFQAHSADPAHEPRTYTVEPGKRLTGMWPTTQAYDLEVRGPNGFYRQFTGRAGRPTVEASVRNDVLEISNAGPARALVKVADRYTGRVTTVAVRPGATHTEKRPTTRTHGWYDLTVTAEGLERRFAGHLEDGRGSISDPALGGLA